jgi:RND family efflux transporter MFP subunit
LAIWKQLVLSAFAGLLAIGLAARLSSSMAGFLAELGLSAPLRIIGASPPEAGEATGTGQAGRGDQRARQAPLVVVQPAGLATINDRVTALGTAAALQSVIVLAQANGTLTEIAVTSGAQVVAGQVIARLESVTQTLALEKAQLAAEDAHRTLERNRVLVQSNAAPANQTQAVELAAKMADLALRSAEKDLQDRIITAPIGGDLGILQVSVGNVMTPQTPIATIENASSLVVNFWLPERLAGQLRGGDTAELMPVARPEITLHGTITSIDNRIDPESGTFQVQARVENPDGRLRAGMSFTVTLRFAGQSHVTVNPLAVQWGSDGAYVWRVSDGKVAKLPVRIIQRNTESVLVAGALAPGDAVVTEGLDGLKPDAEVRMSGAETDAKPAGN